MKKGIFFTIAILSTLGMTLPSITIDDASARGAPKPPKNISNNIKNMNQKLNKGMNGIGNTVNTAGSLLGSLGGAVSAGTQIAGSIQTAQVNTKVAKSQMAQADAVTAEANRQKAQSKEGIVNPEQASVGVVNPGQANVGVVQTDPSKLAEAKVDNTLIQNQIAEYKKKIAELEKQQASSANGAGNPQAGNPQAGNPQAGNPQAGKDAKVKGVAFKLPVDSNIFAGANFTVAEEDALTDEDWSAYLEKGNALVDAMSTFDQAVSNARDDDENSLMTLVDAQAKLKDALDAYSSDKVFQATGGDLGDDEGDDEGDDSTSKDDSSDGMGDDE